MRRCARRSPDPIPPAHSFLTDLMPIGRGRSCISGKFRRAVDRSHGRCYNINKEATAFFHSLWVEKRRFFIFVLREGGCAYTVSCVKNAETHCMSPRSAVSPDFLYKIECRLTGRMCCGTKRVANSCDGVTNFASAIDYRAKGLYDSHTNQKQVFQRSRQWRLMLRKSPLSASLIFRKGGSR